MKFICKLLVIISIFDSLSIFCSDKKSGDLSAIRLAVVVAEHRRLISLIGIDPQRYMTMTDDQISQMINSSTSSSPIDIDALKAVQLFEERNPITKTIKQQLQQTPVIVDQVSEERRKKELRERLMAMRKNLRRS